MNQAACMYLQRAESGTVPTRSSDASVPWGKVFPFKDPPNLLTALYFKATDIPLFAFTYQCLWSFNKFSRYLRYERKSDPANTVTRA